MAANRAGLWAATDQSRLLAALRDDESAVRADAAAVENAPTHHSLMALRQAARDTAVVASARSELTMNAGSLVTQLDEYAAQLTAFANQIGTQEHHGVDETAAAALLADAQRLFDASVLARTAAVTTAVDIPSEADAAQVTRARRTVHQLLHTALSASPTIADDLTGLATDLDD